MCFVFDAGGLANTGSLTLLNSPLLEYLSQEHVLTAPQYVLPELDTALMHSRYDSHRASVLRQVRRSVRTIAEPTYSHCLQVVRHICASLPGKPHFHNGEIHCLSLALHMNRKEGRQVCLVTDDFKARLRQGLSSILTEQQAGWTASSFEIYLYACRAKPGVAYGDVQAASLDYYQVQPVGPSDRILLDSRMENICRTVGAKYRLCATECST